MLKLFRSIRHSFVEENRLSKYLIYAIGEIVLVVIGILIALQVNNWNEGRKQDIKETFIIERLITDLESDEGLITYQIEKANTFRTQLMFCVAVLLDNKQSTLDTFIDNMSPLLTILSFDQNRTTFDNIVSSGQIEYLQNQALTDSIIKYYSDGSNIGWDSGLREYSRNIIAPYLLRFDHIPPKPQTSYRENASREFTQVDVSKSKIAQKSIEDYMDDVFILNVIRQKIYMFEGQIMEYENLKETIGQLKKNLQAELD